MTRRTIPAPVHPPYTGHHKKAGELVEKFTKTYQQTQKLLDETPAERDIRKRDEAEEKEQEQSK